MKILVTGGAGFIASHVSDALVGAGHNVHILDDFSGGREENVPQGAVVHRMDIRDAALSYLWQREGFEMLVHHAAQMDVRRSVADPSFDADVNVRGFLNLMEAGRQNGLRKVVFASTGGAIYGEPDFAPQDEKHALRPLSPYGITKLTTEKYLFYYQQQYGLDYVALRYANVFGPRQNPHGEAGVVAIFCEKLIRGAQPVIYGDGEQTRDYVYVGDVVKANLAAIEYDQSGIFNIGTARETSVNELYRLIRDMLAPAMPELHAPAKPGEQRRSVLDYSLAAETLGWKPTVPLEQGLQATVEYFGERFLAVV
jgi:UDP-glucose 4-epimerase